MAPFDPSTIYLTGFVLIQCGHDDEDIPHWWISRDSGKSWKFIENRFYSYHSDPLFPERAFAFSFEGKIRLLTRNGIETVSDLAVRQLASVPGKPNELLALPIDKETRTLLRSTDGGRSFHKVPIQAKHPISVFETMSRPAGGILAGSYGAGLWMHEPGRPWRQASRGFRESDINLIQMASRAVPADSFHRSFLSARAVHPF